MNEPVCVCVCEQPQMAPTVILIIWVSGSSCNRRIEGGNNHNQCEIDGVRMNTKMFTVHLKMMTTMKSILTVHVEKSY